MDTLSNNSEQLWEQLLQFIDEGRVIPVVGPELLSVTINGQNTLLYRYLAQQLAIKLQLTAEPDDTLNSVTCRYLANGGDREDIYPALKRVMPRLSEIGLPQALLQLAAIKTLKLFVTTSFDPLLAHALNQLRYGGQEKTEVLNFSPEANKDLPSALEKLDRATVFHLFGKLSAVPDYAVTDEDVLEFMHALQSKTTRPEQLFDVLVKQSLIFIGCPLSDWLGRFFVRIGKRERLVSSRSKTDFLAGDQLQNDASLTDFLRYFSSRTKIIPLNSIGFVDELHRRWMALHTDNTTAATIIENEKNDDATSDRMQAGAVFLSYASEDRPAVIQIRDALEQAGIDVWFDRNPEALRVGENFENKIKTNIDQCSLFVPIISQQTQTPKPRFFRTEWNHAQKLAERYPESMRFILPVAIDDIPADAANIPEQFRKLHWQRMPNGQASSEFVTEIKELYRDFQRAQGRSV